MIDGWGEISIWWKDRNCDVFIGDIFIDKTPDFTLELWSDDVIRYD